MTKQQKQQEQVTTEVQVAREQIEKHYTIKDGRIPNPGQFEMEMLYVPYFWEQYLNGVCDHDDGTQLKFRITREERQTFPELGRRRMWITIYQRSDGFVCEA